MHMVIVAYGCVCSVFEAELSFAIFQTNGTAFYNRKILDIIFREEVTCLLNVFDRTNLHLVN